MKLVSAIMPTRGRKKWAKQALDSTFNPIGARGMGEIGITGIAAAIANAVYHATGKRVRDLPITPDKLI